MLAWISDTYRELVHHVTLFKTQSQHYNNGHYTYNDDKVMHASMSFEFFDGLFSCQKP